MLVVLRTFTGFFMGGQLPLSSTMAGEITPTGQWGFVAGLLLFSFGLGSLYSSLIGYLTLGHLGWRYFLGLCAIPSFIQTILSFWYPETPRYIECTGQSKQLADVLTKIGVENGASRDDLNEMLDDVNLFGDVVIARQSEKAATETPLYRLKLTFNLFGTENLRVTLIYTVAWMAASWNQFGLNIFLQEVYQKRGLHTDNIYLATVINGSAILPGAIVAGVLCNRVDKRKVLAGSLLVAGGFALAFSLSVNSTSIRVTSWLYQFFLQIAFVCCYCISPISFNSNLRASAMGWLGAATRAAGAMTPYIFSALMGDSPNSIYHAYLFVLIVNVFTAFLCLFIRQSDLTRFHQI
mmetsp:Transcript_38278/g.62061  ORF Transcript_38278/g.62061 Transcript_38278/m.62061 type:complete len:351 (-) Transcript_38278:132-1184(-)